MSKHYNNDNDNDDDNNNRSSSNSSSGSLKGVGSISIMPTYWPQEGGM